MSEGAAQVGVRVHHVQRTITFYRAVLEPPCCSRHRRWRSSCGETRLFLSVSEALQFDYPASIIYYQVADLDEAYARLERQRVAFEDGPHEVGRLGGRAVWMAFPPNPEQDLLAATSERPVRQGRGIGRCAAAPARNLRPQSRSTRPI